MENDVKTWNAGSFKISMIDEVNRNSAEQNSLASDNNGVRIDFQLLTNKELLSKCKEYGKEALRWKWKFAGLLPEVAKRELWKEAGFTSVFHFSKVLAGMSEMQVKQALRLERKFENLPKLQELFHDGVVSPNKLDRIVSVVTEENEEELAEVVQVHSKQAVATLVKDVQRQSLPGQSMIGIQNMLIATSADGTDGADLQLSELQLSQELKSRLLKLKKKALI